MVLDSSGRRPWLRDSHDLTSFPKESSHATILKNPEPSSCAGHEAQTWMETTDSPPGPHEPYDFWANDLAASTASTAAAPSRTWALPAAVAPLRSLRPLEDGACGTGLGALVG